MLYDYVRRPDGPPQSMVFPGLRGTPEHSIVEFIRETRLALEPYGTFLGLSVFGVAATRPLEVSQDIPAMARESDYIAPMLYPSHWGPASTTSPIRRASRTRSSCARCVTSQADAGHRRACGSVAPGLHSASRTAKRRCVPRPRPRGALGSTSSSCGIRRSRYTSEALDPNAKATKRGLAQPHEGEPIRAHAQGEPEGQARQTAHPKAIAGRLPNELGEIPVLMHHEIRDDRVGDYDQTPRSSAPSSSGL